MKTLDEIGRLIIRLLATFFYVYKCSDFVWLVVKLFNRFGQNYTILLLKEKPRSIGGLDLNLRISKKPAAQWAKARPEPISRWVGPWAPI